MLNAALLFNKLNESATNDMLFKVGNFRRIENIVIFLNSKEFIEVNKQFQFFNVNWSP
jgi:hypothetical protein